MQSKLATLIFFSFLPFLANYLSAQDTIPETDWDNYFSVSLDSILVTAGQFAPTDSRDAIYDVKVIDKKTIRLSGATDLGSLLGQQLAISLSEDRVLGTSFSLLGTDGENVQILLDGVPIAGRRNGNVDLRQINLYNLERIEIIEGPVSVIYGSNALGGVINLITKRSQIEPYEFDQQINVNSFGSLNLNMRAGAWVNKTFLQIGAGYDKSPSINDDTLRSAYWDPKIQYRNNFLLRHDFNEGLSLQYNWGFMNEKQSDLGDLRRPQINPYANDDYYYTNRMDNGLVLKGKVSPNYYLDFSAAFNTYRRRKEAMQYFFDSDTAVLKPIGQDTSRIRSFFNRTALVSQYGKKVEFTVVYDINHESMAEGRLAASAKKPNDFIAISTYALAGSFTYSPVERLTLQPSLRFTHNSSYKAPVVPSFAVKYDLARPLTLRATYARGYRSPALKELYQEFIDGNHYIVGNEDLEAETSHSLLLNLKYKQQLKNQHRLGFILNNSYNKFQNKIDLSEFEPNKFEYKNFNDTVTMVAGIRLEYGFKALNYNLGFSHIWITNDLGNDEVGLANYSRLSTANQTLSYFWGRGKVNFSIWHKKHFKYQWYFQNDGETKEGYVNGYDLLDLSVSRRFWKDRIFIVLGVKNIFNTKRVESKGPTAFHSSDDGFTDVSRGRQFFGQIGLHWTAGNE